MNDVPRFSRHEPDPQQPREKAPPAPASLYGHGAAAGGMINVTVTFEGRVSELRLDPQVLRLGPRRNAETLAAEIKQAVNAAIDHLHEIIREDTSGLLGGIETDLEQLTARHQSTMNQLSDALAQAHRRLDDQAEHRPPDRPGSGH